MNKVSESLLSSVDYIQKFKSSQGCNVNEKFPKDPKFQFLKLCQKDLNLCLPLFDKMVNKTLALSNYTLSEGHCHAFEQACEFLQSKLQKVVLDNCGISDREFACILRGI